MSDHKPHPLDRDLSPGLRFPALDMTKARQIVGHLVQSAAVHSRSRGWLPMIKVDLTHIPLQRPSRAVETFEFVMSPADLEVFITRLEEGIERAKQDAEHGLVLPEEHV